MKITVLCELNETNIKNFNYKFNTSHAMLRIKKIKKFDVIYLAQ